MRNTRYLNECMKYNIICRYTRDAADLLRSQHCAITRFINQQPTKRRITFNVISDVLYLVVMSAKYRTGLCIQTASIRRRWYYITRFRPSRISEKLISIVPNKWFRIRTDPLSGKQCAPNSRNAIDIRFPTSGRKSPSSCGVVVVSYE